MSNLRFLPLMIPQGPQSTLGEVTAELGAMAVEASGSVTLRAPAESVRSEAEPIFIGLPAARERRIVRERAVGTIIPLDGSAAIRIRTKNRSRQREALTSTVRESCRIRFSDRSGHHTSTNEQFTLRNHLRSHSTTCVTVACMVPTVEIAHGTLSQPSGSAEGYRNQQTSTCHWQLFAASPKVSFRAVSQGTEVTIPVETYRIESRLIDEVIPISVRKVAEMTIDQRLFSFDFSGHNSPTRT